jgi:hypothetical protein
MPTQWWKRLGAQVMERGLEHALGGAAELERGARRAAGAYNRLATRVGGLPQVPLHPLPGPNAPQSANVPVTAGPPGGAAEASLPHDPPVSVASLELRDA